MVRGRRKHDLVELELAQVHPTVDLGELQHQRLDNVAGGYLVAQEHCVDLVTHSLGRFVEVVVGL